MRKTTHFCWTVKISASLQLVKPNLIKFISTNQSAKKHEILHWSHSNPLQVGGCFHSKKRGNTHTAHSPGWKWFHFPISRVFPRNPVRAYNGNKSSKSPAKEWKIEKFTHTTPVQRVFQLLSTACMCVCVQCTLRKKEKAFPVEWKRGFVAPGSYPFHWPLKMVFLSGARRVFVYLLS